MKIVAHEKIYLLCSTHFRTKTIIFQEKFDFQKKIAKTHYTRTPIMFWLRGSPAQ